MDNVTPRTRSRIMARNKSAGTGPETILLREVRARGLRPKLNDRAYPGTPDLCFPRARVAVFVDGCFWHGCPTHYRPPQTRTDFWRDKMERVHRHDARVRGELRRGGWRVLQFWECEVRASAARCGLLVADTWKRRKGRQDGHQENQGRPGRR